VNEYEGNLKIALKLEQRVAFIQFLNELFELATLIALAIMSRSLILMTGAVGSVTLLVQALVVVLISRRLAKNESYEYDYGMGKFESFGGLIANLFMLVGLVAVLFTTIIVLFNPVQPGELLLWGIIAKGINTIVDVILYFMQQKINKMAKSTLFEAEDHVIRKNLTFDFIAVSAIAALYLFRFIPGIVYVELLLCLVYAVIMIIKLVHPLKVCAYDLLDKTLDEDVQLKVMKAIAAGDDLYDSFHTVRTRSSGQKVYIDLLIGFNNDKTFEEVSAALDRFEELIKAEIPNCVVSIVLTK